MKTENAIVVFDPKAVATYGNQMLNVIVQHEEAREDAERAIRQADEREKIIDFELTRVALFLHKDEKIDLYGIYQEDKNSSTRLYRSILVETGVLKRDVDTEADKVVYDFTDKALKGKFDFNEELKEKDEEEYKKRRSRRNALNMRLARVCKAAIALYEAKATTDDLQIAKDEESGELQAVITKGPKEVMGKEGKVQIHSKSVSPVEGASATPTITGLAKLADNVHKPKTESKQKAESTDKKAPSDNDFASVVNAAIMVVKAKEGKVTAQEKQLLTNLQKEIEAVLNVK